MIPPSISATVTAPSGLPATIHVPASGQKPAPIDPMLNGIPPESEAREMADQVSGSLPDPIRDLLYGALITRVNDVIFKSDPPNKVQLPKQSDSWNFTVMGDSGNGTKAQKDVAKNVLENKPEIVISVGDQVYPNSEAKNWRNHVDPPEMMGNIIKKSLVLPSVGNHDIDPSPAEYFKRFPHVNGSRYYSADYRNVHVVSVDTNQSLDPGSEQYKWLEQDLASSDAPWKIVNVHHPMMSVISKYHYKETSKLPQTLGPLLAKHGVDLVVAGHEHWYERSKPLNAVGTIQVTAGGGGGALYPFPYPQTKWSDNRDVDFGHVDFEVRGDDELVGRYRTRDGKVQDTFVIENRTPAGWKAPADLDTRLRFPNNDSEQSVTPINARAR